MPFSLPRQLRAAITTLCAPRYVQRGGEQNISNPFRLRDVAIDAFYFRADYGALLRLVERDLNAVLRKADFRKPLGLLLPSVRVVPLAPVVMLVCAQTARIEVPKVGFIPEVDVAFWLPVLLLKRVGPLLVPWQIAFYQPYLFVDSGQAMATGRETYGYHKMLGDFDLPSDPAHPQKIEVRSIAWRNFGEGQKAALQRVFTLEETSGAAPASSEHSSFAEALKHMLATIADNGNELLVRALNKQIDLLELFDLTRVQQVFLKQFRAIENPARACYQAVAQVGAPLRTFQRGGLLRGRYQLTLEELASLPIRSELGLAHGTLEPFASFWGVIDFDLEQGTTLGRT